MCRDSKNSKLPKECDGKPASQTYYVEGGVCYALNVGGKIKTVARTISGNQPSQGV